jgi:hypothetical protein
MSLVRPYGTKRTLRVSAQNCSTRYCERPIERQTIPTCFASFIATQTFGVSSRTVFHIGSSSLSLAKRCTFMLSFTAHDTTVDGWSGFDFCRSMISFSTISHRPVSFTL